jgi:hypothetical protein
MHHAMLLLTSLLVDSSFRLCSDMADGVLTVVPDTVANSISVKCGVSLLGTSALVCCPPDISRGEQPWNFPVIN